MTKRLKRDPAILSLKAVLSEDLTQIPKPKPVIIGHISSKKNISEVVSILARILPLEDKFKFLKRVGTHLGEKPVILISCSMTLIEAEVSLSPSLSQLISKGLEFPLMQHEIICDPPSTRAQFEVSRLLWPCHFHEDKDLEALLSRTRPDIWGEEQFSRRVEYMNMAFLFAFSNNSCSAVVIVDPQAGVVKARSYSTQEVHPMRHAAMNVVDAVAHSQGGGAWPGILNPD